MTKSNASKTPAMRAKRTRLYFRFMDLCLFFALLVIVSTILDFGMGIDMMPTGTWYGAILAIPSIICMTILPTFLIWARFMRDEYAEMLWQRTMVIVGYAAATLPMVILLGAWFTYWAIDRQNRGALSFLKEEVLVYSFLGVSWSVFMLVFVCTFQFLRWKDSR